MFSYLVPLQRLADFAMPPAQVERTTAEALAWGPSCTNGELDVFICHSSLGWDGMPRMMHGKDRHGLPWYMTGSPGHLALPHFWPFTAKRDLSDRNAF